MKVEKCGRSAMEKTKKGQADTGPVRNGSTAKQPARRGGGGATKNGGIFGNWQKSKKSKP
jgi:hypothetical protein